MLNSEQKESHNAAVNEFHFDLNFNFKITHKIILEIVFFFGC